MLESLTNYAASLSPSWFYGFLFLSAYVENIFPPVPGDTVTVFAAYLVGRGHRGFGGVFAATTLGSTAGFMTYYWLGRLIPQEYFARRNFRFLPASSFNAAARWFQKYGYWVVLMNRFMSGARGVISIVCGLYRLPWAAVLVLATFGCAAWNAILIYAGFLAGANWMMVDRLLRDYSRILLAVGIILVVGWVLRRRLVRGSRTNLQS